MKFRTINLNKFTFPATLLVVILGFWIGSPITFQYSFWKLAGIFGPISDLQNVFAPISALFSGAAVIGAIYTIYIQVKLAQRQQFENTYFNLLSIHKDNAKAIVFPLSVMDKSNISDKHQEKEYIEGFEAFKQYYNFLVQINTYIFTAAQGELPHSTPFATDVKQFIDQQLGQSRDDYNNITLHDVELFKLVYNSYTEFADLYYSNYARHLYHILKYITENTPSSESVKTYIRILRAQLSKYEAALLFYRAIMSPDKDKKNPNCSKYQKLIEETSFLHLLCDDDDLLFDRGLAGHMSPNAFNNHEEKS